jgi:outer membrane protein assembly factor BamD
LVPEAKQRLREVQEVLADREFMIGRFYWLRESFPAAEARLKTMTDTYPLYSRADEALMMLGQAYESQIETVKRIKGLEKSKAPLIKSYTDSAAAAYARLIERYPISDRAANARDHLKALDRPVPTPSAEAIAEAKAEEASRNELGRFGKIMSPLRKRPDTSLAAKVGEPAIADVEATSAPQIVRHSTNLAMGIPDSGNVSVEAVKSGTPGASQPPPRTEAAPTGEAQPAGEPKGDSTAIPELVVNGPGSKPPAASTPPSSAAPGAPAANQGSTSDGSGPAAGATANPPANGNADAKAQDQGKKDQTDSSSKKKKKKKLIIF